MKRLLSRLLAPIALALVVLGSAAAPAAADPVTVRSADHGTYGRVVFNWPAPVYFESAIENGTLVLNFNRPVEGDVRAAVRGLRKYLKSGEVSQDGHTVSFALSGPMIQNAFDLGRSVVIDLTLGGAVKGTEKPLDDAKAAPREPTAKAPRVTVRSGQHANYSRLVFDWPDKVAYEVSESDGDVSIRFHRPARLSVAKMVKRPPEWVSAVSASVDGDGATFAMTVAPGASIKHFLSGNRVVVDVQRPDPAAAKAAKKKTPIKTAKKTETPKKPAAKQQAAAKPAPNNDGKPIKLTPKPAVSAPAPAPSTAANLGQPFTVRFAWKEPVAAAVFRRAGNLWVIFDAPRQINVKGLKAAAGPIITTAEQMPISKKTVLRLTTPPGINPELRREALTWVLEFGRNEPKPERTLNINAQPASPVGPRIFVPVPEPGEAFALEDPVVGDTLVVVPVIPLSHGIQQQREYPHVRFLPTLQGLVVQPKTDDIRVRALRQGVEMVSATGLNITPIEKESVAALSGTGIIRPATTVLRLDQWRSLPFNAITPTRKRLERTAATAKKGAHKEKARLELARFNLSNLLTAETLAVLKLLREDRKTMEEEPEFRALRGIAQFLMGRIADARADLYHASLDGNDEGLFWRAAVLAREEGMRNAAETLRAKGGLTRSYPKELKMFSGLLVAEASIVDVDVKQAEYFLKAMEREKPTVSQLDEIAYLRGRLLELGGDFDGAIAKWEEAEEGFNRYIRAKATASRAELLLKLRRLAPHEVAKELERLRFAWRGDNFEFSLLRRLGELYMFFGDYRKALRTLRQAATYFRTHKKAPDVSQDMVDAFHRLYLKGLASNMPPVTAIALYDEFRELTPAGEKGDEMIRNLADRLVGVDLLDRGAALLDNQVRFRLKGTEKARVGARLTLVHLMNEKPDQALQALDISNAQDMPEALVTQRRHLRARALNDLDQGVGALTLLKGDKSLDADRLRVEIYWKRQEWSNVAQALRYTLKGMSARKNRTLDDTQARSVLDLAVVLTLGGDERGVDRLRQDYGLGMEGTPYRDGFRLISTPQSKGVIDYRSVAAKVTDAEQFQAFLGAYRQRLKAGGLSSVN